jgi:hypothetical protein
VLAIFCCSFGFGARIFNTANFEIQCLSWFPTSSEKKTQVIFAHNGVGKTRLSRAFKELATKSDTLYFNAFTEDLFHWDNDLENDMTRVLIINSQLSNSKKKRPHKNIFLSTRYFYIFNFFTL